MHEISLVTVMAFVDDNLELDVSNVDNVNQEGRFFQRVNKEFIPIRP